MDNFDPPAELSDASKALWVELVPTHVRRPARRVLLEQALLALDRAAACRAVLNKAGLTVTCLGSRTLHVHPLVAVEQQARALAVQTLRALDLGIPDSSERIGHVPETKKPSRPSVRIA